MPILAITAALLAGAAPPPSSPLQVTSRIQVERRVAGADGTTRIVTTDGKRARPGDRLIVSLAYRNTGRQPIADLVLADRVPVQLAYRGPAEGSPPPELSVDGSRFAALAALTARDARPATPDDVVAVRWRLAQPLAPGAGGTVAFRAVLK